MSNCPVAQRKKLMIYRNNGACYINNYLNLPFVVLFQTSIQCTKIYLTDMHTLACIFFVQKLIHPIIQKFNDCKITEVHFEDNNP